MLLSCFVMFYFVRSSSNVQVRSRLKCYSHKLQAIWDAEIGMSKQLIADGFSIYSLLSGCAFALVTIIKQLALFTCWHCSQWNPRMQPSVFMCVSALFLFRWVQSDLFKWTWLTPKIFTAIPKKIQPLLTITLEVMSPHLKVYLLFQFIRLHLSSDCNGLRVLWRRELSDEQLCL